MTRTHPARAARPGFSLPELLVAIAIIAILVGMSATALMPLFTGQKTKNTKTLFSKLNPELSKQWRSTVETAGDPPPYVLTNLAGGFPHVAKAIWVKLVEKAEFPMNYAEALDPAGGDPALQAVLLPRVHFVKALKGGLVKSKDPWTESSALLLIALQAGRKGSQFKAEEGLGASAIKDTDGDGVPEIVDGHGKAIFFCRWGTGNPELLKLASSNQDDDIEKALIDTRWNTSGGAVPLGVAKFQQLCYPIRDANGVGIRNTTLPTVMSAGKDEQYGVDYLLTPSGTDARDNIYSFKVK